MHVRDRRGEGEVRMNMACRGHGPVSWIDDEDARSVVGRVPHSGWSWHTRRQACLREESPQWHNMNHLGSWLWMRLFPVDLNRVDRFLSLVPMMVPENGLVAQYKAWFFLKI